MYLNDIYGVHFIGKTILHKHRKYTETIEKKKRRICCVHNILLICKSPVYPYAQIMYKWWIDRSIPFFYLYTYIYTCIYLYRCVFCMYDVLNEKLDECCFFRFTVLFIFSTHFIIRISLLYAVGRTWMNWVTLPVVVWNVYGYKVIWKIM